MHIDQEKLLDLIADTSGISRENAEKQLKDLVAEINEALEEGEAYEIDGFGIFSQVGNKVIFIPDDNLETEINYKYAGMEPIAMEESGSSASEPDNDDVEDEDTEEDPFEGLLDDDVESEEEDQEEELKMDSASESEDDKAEQVEDAAEPEDLIPEEAPGPEKWGIDTYRDEKDENAFSGLLGDSKPLEDDDDDDDDDEEETEEVAEEKEEPTVISSGASDDMDEDTMVEESLLSGDEDFDEDFDDPFAELARTARGKASDSDDETDNEEGSYYSSFDPDDDEDDIDEEDDVFAELDEMEEPESRSKKEKEEEEIVPVVSSSSSDSDDKPEEKKEEKEYVPRSLAKDKKKQGGNSAFIWVAIVILLAVGVTYGLASFNVIYIEGISPVSVPQVSSNTAGPTTDTPPATEQEAQATEDQTASAEVETGNEAPDEQVTEATPTQTEATNTATETNTAENSSTEGGTTVASSAESAAAEMATMAETGQEMFGLMGEAVAEANSGYTIVLYSLSQKENADDAFDRLSSSGYRTLMIPKENARYGTLWQIGIGQFQTLTDAALAAEDLGDDIPENYMISRIN